MSQAWERLEPWLQEQRASHGLLLFGLSSLPLLLALWGFQAQALAQPELHALFHRDLLWGAHSVLSLLICWLAVMTGVGWFGRERVARRHAWLGHLVVSPTLLVLLLLWVGYGFLDTPLGTPCLIVLILARALFPGRVLLPALALGGGLLLALGCAATLGHLHASPLLVSPVFQGGHLSPWWARWLQVVFNAGAWPMAMMAVFVFYRISRDQRSLESLAHTDALTGLYNRRKFHTLLDLESHRHRRSGQPLSVIVLDIDAFKSVNDAHGHDAGDIVLARLGGLILAGLRQQVDVAARLGGDEFAILLPQTDLAGAQYVARKLMEAMRHTTFTWGGQSRHVTLTAGVACVSDGNGELALREADDNLYVAKRIGHNNMASALVQP